jgi:hypothetical protein
MGRTCDAHGRDEKCIKSLIGKPEGKGSHQRLRRRWKGDTKMVGS